MYSEKLSISFFANIFKTAKAKSYILENHFFALCPFTQIENYNFNLRGPSQVRKLFVFEKIMADWEYSTITEHWEHLDVIFTELSRLAQSPAG